jgi:aspartyl-tRNA(Asn)/glutamyl-tRNA(Gln) amidotransferase subunit A
MADRELHDLSIREIGEGFRNGVFSSETLTRHLLDRIKTFDGDINAFVTVTEEAALEDARRADHKLAEGRDCGPLHGVPVSLKDIYDTAGIRTTCCSKVRLDNVPAADSEVARRLREAGAVLLGKVATMEFAMGGPSFDLPFPAPRNPWNPEHLTNGSSSGSGAAIASRFTRLSMGSDTIGSIRGPAASCGVVGLKPTYGRISLRGIFPLAYSLDHPGPLARSVEDVAFALQAIAGHDPADPASVNHPVSDYLGSLDAGVKGLRMAYPRRFIERLDAVSSEVLADWRRQSRGLPKPAQRLRRSNYPTKSFLRRPRT